MNAREFCKYLTAKRLERQRKEAESANSTIKKPPAVAKARKTKQTRTA